MKHFALPDTLPDPYFQIHAGGSVVVHVCPQGDDYMVEIWRDKIILCRLFATSIQIAEEPANQCDRHVVNGKQRKLKMANTNEHDQQRENEI